MQNFTPFSSLAGGVLIGLAAALLMLFNGRVAGISSMFKGVVFTQLNDSNFPWRLAFLSGLILAPQLLTLSGMNVPEIHFSLPILVYVIAGLLVGFGSVIANGCTSGHAVCGLARLSPRSIAATITFMCTAFITVYSARHFFNLGN